MSLTQHNKTCSKCNQTKSITDFYKKGSVIDSHCKECKKSARRNSYVSKTHTGNYETVRDFFTAYFADEIKKLDQIYKRLEKLLEEKQLGVMV